MHVSHANWLFDWGSMELISQLTTAVCQFGHTVAHVPDLGADQTLVWKNEKKIPMSLYQGTAIMQKRQND